MLKWMKKKLPWKTNRKTIDELLTVRDDLYTKYSTQIVNIIRSPLQQCFFHITKIPNVNMKITSLSRNLNGLIKIIGMYSTETLTDETFSITLPTHLLERTLIDNDVTLLLTFLEEINMLTEIDNMSEQEFMGIINEFLTNKNNKLSNLTSFKKLTEAPTSFCGFDIDSLTDEQRLSIMSYNATISNEIKH